MNGDVAYESDAVACISDTWRKSDHQILLTSYVTYQIILTSQYFQMMTNQLVFSWWPTSFTWSWPTSHTQKGWWPINEGVIRVLADQWCSCQSIGRPVTLGGTWSTSDDYVSSLIDQLCQEANISTSFVKKEWCATQVFSARTLSKLSH